MRKFSMKYSYRLAACSAALLAVAAVTPAAGAGSSDSSAVTPPKAENWISITAWNYADLYDGWQASTLLDATATGRTGAAVGEVEDLIIGNDGKIKAAVIEGGGYLDIGDTHARIPWDMVDRQNGEAVSVPFDPADFDSGILIDIDDLAAREGNFRLRELIGDTVRDGDGVGYGYVSDVVFSQNGEVKAVIVAPDYSYGYRTAHPVPYSAAGYNPHRADYWVPYLVGDLSQIEPFDGENMAN